MRSLQRLRHVRPAVQESAFRQTQIHRLDTKAVKRREREIWLRRLRRAAFLVAVAITVVGVLSAMAGSRIVASGLVRGNIVVLEAPSDARVAQWFVNAGGMVQIGDPLVELQPTKPDALRAELRARWDASLAQLAWFDAGGELELSGQPLRRDLVETSRRNEALQRADRQDIAAELTVRQEELRLGEAAIEAARRALVAAKQSGQARELRQVEQLHQAQIEAGQASADQVRAADLHAEGIQSLRASEVATRTARVQASRAAALQSELALIVAERDGEVNAADAALLTANAQWTVAQARLKEAETALAAADARVAAWALDAEYNEAFVPEERYHPETIRAARRVRLEADVQVARAAYESHVRVFGDRTILAHMGGKIDEVLALEGSVVNAGDPLVRYQDPDSMVVVVYPTPSAAAELMVGDPCTLHCAADGCVGQARILSIGSIWIEAPEGMASKSGGDRVAVTLSFEEGCSPFSANAPVKAAFKTDRWTAIKQGVLNWFSK